MISIRVSLIASAATVLINCTDLPDYDDPRDQLAEEAVASCDNLLANGDFDDGPVSWNASVDNIIYDDDDVPTGAGIRADTGNYFAWLGGEYSTTRTVSQSFRVPQGATKLKLKGKYFVASETESGPIEDTLKIELTDGAANTALATALTLSNVTTTVMGDAPFRWTDLNVMINSEQAAGKTAVLRLLSVNDGANNTNFLFDSLTLKSASCP